MIKRLLILLSFIVLTKTATAQDFKYGEVDPGEIEMERYSKDTSAHAVVLNEFGRAVININSQDNINLIYEYHVKIKIFDGKGLDNGSVQIPVYNNSTNESYESVDEISGITFYKDNGGLTQQVELDSKQVYFTKIDKHWGVYKFVLPGIRNGCIIEYKYRIESPYFNNFHSWAFQGDIPKVYSEYEAHIPGFWTFNASLKGNLKLSKSTSEIENGCFTTHGAKSDCSLMVYGMKDIPAFKPEEYMTSPKNFLSAINYELVEYTNPYNGVKKKVTQEWSDIDYQLKNEPDLGGQLKRKSLFKDIIPKMTPGKTDDLVKAKAIYAYIQKWFKWNSYYGIFSVEGIGKALDARTGSVADINLSLATALNAAGLNAETVLLSTRDNGFINTLYPVIGDFNYVITKVNIGDKSYLLDATDPLLAFGMLPFKCLNDQGRVLSLDKPSYWIDLSNVQKEGSTHTYDLTLQPDGKITGTMTSYYIGYKGYERRKAIKKFNNEDEYVESVGSKWSKLKILKSEIINLDSLDQPLGEKYQIELDVYNKLTGHLTFNPFIMDWINTNPFKLEERSFPVDWGMPSSERFILTMHLPDQYVIETPPQLLSAAMPNNGGRFLTSYESEGNQFTFSHAIQFNKSIYSDDEYGSLKELYNKIILSEKAPMVFKKKSE